MKISLFDSKSKEKLALDKEKINIYLCGPTVYDEAHLGHARSAVCFDLLFRFLRSLGKDVKFARNYTDIDDKILKKMKEDSQSLEGLSNFYIASYERDMRALNVLEPSFKPRATHYIKQMISFIERLEKKGFTYTLKDGIYFDTAKDKGYFSLSHRDLQNNVSRLENEVAKKNESDFVLWKFDNDFYEASFSTGRPGWHTECVVMIEELFQGELDIHCGGVDLLFPHHENEAAQCRCAENRDLARIWLHNGFVKINDEKMSKSLGNSFFVRDTLKEFQGEALRFYLLSSHYRAHFSYNVEDLKAAKKRLDKFYRLKKRLDLGALKDFDSIQKCEFQSEISKEILKALSDDLNISKALALLDEFIINANAKLDEALKDKNLKENLKQILQELALIFGFGLGDTNLYFQFGVSEEERLEIERKIGLRNEAKKNKDYERADAIRAELAQKNILLLDTPSGVIWEKNND